MRAAARIVTSAALFLALLTVARATDEPPALQHNPFSRPSSEVTRSERGAVDRDDGTGVALDLQATMVGNVNSLANVAGRILKPGDEIQGYRLVAIHESYAVFEKGGKTTTVYVRPHLAEDNE